MPLYPVYVKAILYQLGWTAIEPSGRFNIYTNIARSKGTWMPFGTVSKRVALGSESNFSERLEMMLLPLIHAVTLDTSKLSQEYFKKQERFPSSQVLPCIFTLCREMARDNLKGCPCEPSDMPSSIFKKRIWNICRDASYNTNLSCRFQWREYWTLYRELCLPPIHPPSLYAHHGPLDSRVRILELSSQKCI